jgi:hypothetical protein
MKRRRFRCAVLDTGLILGMLLAGPGAYRVGPADPGPVILRAFAGPGAYHPGPGRPRSAPVAALNVALVEAPEGGPDRWARFYDRLFGPPGR